MDCRRIIQESIDYIEDNLKTEIRSRELAGQAGFSLYHYYRLFVAATGMPVMQFVLRRRLLHAIYEIKGGRKRIDVILEYGFDTYSGYYKAFRREFGCTPSAYLKKSRAKHPCRINLFEEAYMNITHKKASEILTHWKLEDQPVTDIYFDGSGNRHENAFYVGNDYVLKFTANMSKLRNDILLSKDLENIGLWAAAPVRTENGEEYIQIGEAYFYVTRRLSGSQMGVQTLYEGFSGENARFVGEIIGQLHLALEKATAIVRESDLRGSVVNWALPRVRECLTLPDGFCRDFQDALDRLYEKLPRQIIHRDPNPGNIILSEDKWGFIDFELTERNVRIYDICYAATAILSESFDNRDRRKWLEIYRNLCYGYDSVARLTQEEFAAIPYILLANQMVCVAWFSEQEKYREIYEVNKRMTLWLIDVFDELKFR